MEAGIGDLSVCKKRWDVAIKDKAFASIQNLPLIKTQVEHFFDALHKGTVSMNVFLRRIQNFALDMNWLPRSNIRKKIILGMEKFQDYLNKITMQLQR